MIGSTPTRRAFIIFGKADFASEPFENVEVHAMTSGATDGVVVHGPNIYQVNCFQIVRGAGDLNDDGFDDVATDCTRRLS